MRCLPTLTKMTERLFTARATSENGWIGILRRLQQRINQKLPRIFSVAVISSDNFPVWRRSKDWHISVIALFENQPSKEIY